MLKIFWTKESLQNLIEIESYIARDNPIAAEKFINKLVELAESLTKNQERGRVVPEFSISQIRELLYKNYRMVYITKKRRIEILTVFEGHKLLKEK